MSDLTKRLRTLSFEDTAEAADRIEHLERVLAQAREAVELGLENASQIAGEYHGAMAGFRQSRHDALDADVEMTKRALAAIDEALKLAENAKP